MKKYYLTTLIIFLGVLVFFSFGVQKVKAQTSVQNVSGWAWSSGVSWISFGSWPNRVRYEPSSGNLLGYAWNNNIGWIRFDPTGPYPGLPQHGARVDSSTNNVLGWARACSVFRSGCSGDDDDLKSDIQRGGWDGWVKMTADQSDVGTPSYGVSAGANSGFPPNSLSGEAWGGDVLGWINFCPGAVIGTSEECVYIDQLVVSCEGSPNPVDTNTQIDWAVNTIGGSSNLTYNYKVNTGTPLGGYTNDDGTVTISTTAPGGSGNVIFDVEVVDNSAPGTVFGHTLCSVDVTEANPTRLLRVNINGEGSVTSNPSGINCISGTGTCSYSFVDDDVVDLTASGTNFVSWSGDVPGCGSNITCQVTMNQRRDVTATFSDPASLPPTDSLVLESNIIRIDAHNSGLPVRSPSVKIVNESNVFVDLCVKEITSKIDGSSLNGDGGIIDTVYDDLPEYFARCYFENDDNSVKTCDESVGGSVTSSVQLRPKDSLISPLDDSADFSITIPVKMLEIKGKSPYNVKIGTCGDSPEANFADIDIEFQYQPLTFEPQ